MTITLRRHQKEAADAIEAALRAGINRPLVDMCVASGKSYTYAEVARRALLRQERVIIGAHTRELVEQNAEACRLLMPDVEVGINAAALNERSWRAPVISAAIQSVYQYAHNFGPIDLLIVDEAHLTPHSEAGMYHQLRRELGCVPIVGGSGTVFRLQGGSLVEGEEAPFDRVVYEYPILSGIRDGYLCEAFSVEATDKIDPSRLRIAKATGDYSGESQDAQMIALMDNHIVQMLEHGRDRRAWLVFEASTKAATAMAARMNEFGIPTGLVLGKTPAGERRAIIAAFRAGRLRALVNIVALTTGFNVPWIDFLIMRRRTASLGLYIQIIGRLLRVAEGKVDGIVADFAGNIDIHGAIDCINPPKSKSRLIKCDACGTNNPPASMFCWSCDAALTKNCPACLKPISRGTMICPHCEFNMAGEPVEREPQKLLETPSGAALLSTHRKGTARIGGWLPVRSAYEGVLNDADGGRHVLAEPVKQYAAEARWVRIDPFALLLPNGSARSSARVVNADGHVLVVPMPAVM